MQSVITIIPTIVKTDADPDQFLKDFGGWPLLRYSLEAALDITVPSRIYVVSNHQGVLNKANDFGAREIRVSDDRPELLDDYVSLLNFCLSYIESDNQYGFTADYISLLNPLFPFRMRENIQRSCNLIQSSLQPDYVISVKPLRTVKPCTGSRAEYSHLEPGHVSYEQKVVVNANAFYFLRTMRFLSDQVLIGEDAMPITLSYPEYVFADNSADDIQEVIRDYSLLSGYRPDPQSLYENVSVSKKIA